jgi:cytochrome P450
MLIYEALGPQLVLFAGKNAIQRIIVEDDMLKGPEYEWLRDDPQVTNLITERDKAAYRQKVRHALFVVISPYPSRRLTMRQRRLLSPGFSISYLNGLEPLMLQCVQAFIETLDSRCADVKGSAVVDMYAMMSNLTSVSILPTDIIAA